jgi:hypothetical protein
MVALQGENTVILPPTKTNGTSRRRRIEIIGDSNSNGFGADGKDDWECVFAFVRSENCYDSWGAVLSRMLDAELHLEAWTGMGVVKNAVDFSRDTKYTMPCMFFNFIFYFILFFIFIIFYSPQIIGSERSPLTTIMLGTLHNGYLIS